MSRQSTEDKHRGGWVWNGGIEYGFMSFTTDRDVALSVLVF